jgi:hypothetical protein
MKIFNKITNGILLIIIGLLHTKLVVTADGFGTQFLNFSKTWFFRISGGLNELPAAAGKTNFEAYREEIQCAASQLYHIVFNRGANWRLYGSSFRNDLPYATSCDLYAFNQFL